MNTKAMCPVKEEFSKSIGEIQVTIKISEKNNMLHNIILKYYQCLSLISGFPTKFCVWRLEMACRVTPSFSESFSNSLFLLFVVDPSVLHPRDLNFHSLKPLLARTKQHLRSKLNKSFAQLLQQFLSIGMQIGSTNSDAASRPTSLSLMLFKVMLAGLPSIMVRFEA